MTKVEIIQRGTHVFPTGVVRRAGGDLEPLPESREEFSAELVVQPIGVSLVECPIGLFRFGNELCLKTEYGNNEGRIDAYIASSGEFFWGDPPQTIKSQRNQVVHPAVLRASGYAELVAALEAARSYIQSTMKLVHRQRAQEALKAIDAALAAAGHTQGSGE